MDRVGWRWVRRAFFAAGGAGAPRVSHWMGFLVDYAGAVRRVRRGCMGEVRKMLYTE